MALPKLLFAAACLFVSLHARAQDGPLPDAAPVPDVARVHLISNEDILHMAKSGLSDDVIINTIKTQPGRYNVTPDDLITLKSSGLSDKIILTMQAYGSPQPKRTSTGLRPRTAPAGAAPFSAAYEEPVNPTGVAPGVDEIGVYYKDRDGQYVELKAERVTFESGGWWKSTVTHGIVGKDMNGHVDGQSSTLILTPGTELLIYTPYGTQAEEYSFLQFREHSSKREFRVNTGGVFHSQSGSQRDEIEFTPKKIGQQMYTYTLPNDLPKGEFGVLPSGSSNMQGISGSGKIFTFSIREENHTDKKK